MKALRLDTVPLPGGSTWIGTSQNDKFAHEAEPPGEWTAVEGGFAMARCPVTIREWSEFEPGRFEGLDDELPAHGISWNDAMTFVNWLRRETGDETWDFPTGPEWEHAARAGSSTVFPEGDTLGPAQANFLFDESIRKVGPGRIMPVGSYPPNAFGLCDMLGNVCEWTKDPGRRNGTHRIRGGAWDYLPRLLRCSWSDEIPDSSERDNVGFRLVHRTGMTPKAVW